MKILVTGATGLVGKRIVKQLLKQDHQVHVLTRNMAKGLVELGKHCQFFLWEDTSVMPPVEAFQGVEGIINLMGEGIADKKWSKTQKEKIYESRITSTRRIIERLKELPHKPHVLISTSAVGIYGNRGDEEINETSRLGSQDDFLTDVCMNWEKEALAAQDLGMRVAIIRTGVVLAQDGGALKKMLPIFKLGGGGPVGFGKQYMSWIQVEDIASMYVFALTHDNVEGIYNGTAPTPATSKDFAKTLGKVLHRPAFAPAPSFMLKLVFGEMSQVLLDGQKVIPQNFMKAGFRFKYPNLEMALTETLRSES